MRKRSLDTGAVNDVKCTRHVLLHMCSSYNFITRLHILVLTLLAYTGNGKLQ